MKKLLSNKILLILLSIFFVLSTSVGVMALRPSINGYATQGTSVFEMVDGASIRVDEPTGMRFSTKMSTNYYNELTAENTTSKLNVAIVPYDWYEQYLQAEYNGVLCEYLALQSKNFLNLEIPADKIYLNEKDGYYYVNAVISNVLFNNYNILFVGVAYIQRNGQTTTYEEVGELNKLDNARSIFSIAYKALNLNYDVDELLEKALYNSVGVIYNASTEKYEYKGQSYDKLADVGLNLSIEGMSLSLSEDSLSILKGESVKLEKSLKFADGTAFGGDGMFVWDSSDETVATIDDNGNITTLKDGKTQITLSAIDGKYTATCDVEVYSYEGMNFASESNFANYNLVEIYGNYDTTNNAIKLTNKYVDVHYTHSQLEMPIMDTIRAAKAAGMKILTFEYFAQGFTVSGSEDVTIRILANNSTGDISQDRSVVTDFLLTKELEGRWNKVIIDLTTTNPAYSANIANENYENLVFCIGGAVDGTFSIRNMVFGDAEDYETAFVTNYFDNVNYTEYQHLNDWIVLDGVDAYRDSINQWGVIRMAKKGANISGARDHIEIEIMDEVRAAKAAGKKLLTFEYMIANGLYGQGANQPLMWVSANNGNGTAVSVSYWITQQVNFGATEAKYYKVYIDLTKNNMIDATDYKYLSILIGGEHDGWLCIRNMKFEGEAEYNAIKYDIVDYSDLSYWLGRAPVIWENDCALDYDYDTTNNAVIFKGKEVDLFHYGSSFIKIMDDIRDAIRSGKTKLSFEYYAENITSTQGSRLWIIATNIATKDLVGSSSYWIHFDQTLQADSWVKVEISLDLSTIYSGFAANINNEDYEYLGIAFDGGPDAVLRIREFKFS